MEILEQLLEKILNEQLEQKKLLEALKNKDVDLSVIKSLETKIIQNQSLVEELENTQKSTYNAIINSKNETIRAVRNKEVQVLDNPEPKKMITIFGGNNAVLSYKYTLTIVSVAFVLFFGTKYISEYLTEKERVDFHKSENKIFKNYMITQEFRYGNNQGKIKNILSKIRNNDSTFFSEYYDNVDYYNEEEEKERKKKRIKELQESLKE